MVKESFWRRGLFGAGSVSIQVKITGIVAIGIIASFAVLAWHFYQDTAVILRKQLQQREVAIGTTLAMYAGEQTVSDNFSSLSRLARNIRESDKDVVYILVLDAEGIVAVQDIDQSFKTEFLGTNQVLSGEPYHLQQLKIGQDTIHDVAVPVLGGKSGTVRVGLREASIYAVLKGDVWHILLWPGLICVAWLFIAYGFSSLLTGPAYRLLETTRGLGQDDSSRRQPSIEPEKTESGVGSDGRYPMTFDEMSKELKRREEVRLQLINKIINGEEMRQQLLNKVINAQEEERKRIARELHDQTGQSLTSLIVGLKVLEAHSSPEALESIADLKQQANMIFSDIHGLALELRPSSLDDLGLIAALRQYTRDYTGKFGIEIDFQTIGLEEKRLPPRTEIALYRIVQEALTNIVKHAGATKVSVLIKRRGTSIVTIVEDNGKGFNVNEVFATRKSEHKLGLYGMQERATIISGVLTVESTLGEGTTVFVEVPLEEEKVLNEKDTGINS